MGAYIFLIVFLVVIVLFSMSVKVVRQSTAIVIERLGQYNKTLTSGLKFIIPFFEKVSNLVILKERVEDFEPQAVITKDNVTMKIDTVVYFQVTDPKLFTYGVHKPISALSNLTATTLRNIIGDLELDQTLTSRDTINQKMRIILDEATDPWGMKVNRVEVKNILPPKDIQEAMEKQMRAERERRESILRAEGEKRAKILIAEGDKESAILRAQGEKEALVTKSEGEATAIKKIYDAQAFGVKLINDSNPKSPYLTLKGYEASEKVADGKSTKLIIPSNIQDLTSIVASLNEVIKEPKE